VYELILQRREKLAMRHVTIKRFGPIREIDIDLDKSLEVIIGPQASGKSTFSKVVYFCRKLRDYFLQYLDSVINTELYYGEEFSGADQLCGQGKENNPADIQG